VAVCPLGALRCTDKCAFWDGSVHCEFNLAGEGVGHWSPTFQSMVKFALFAESASKFCVEDTTKGLFTLACQIWL